MMYPIFGDSPTIRILDWLIDNQTFDHSVKEIAEGAEISIITMRRNFQPLLDYGVVVANRTVGRDPMYVLDLKNQCTKAIIAFDSKIAECCKAATEEDGEEEAIDGESEEFTKTDEAYERVMEGPPEY